MPRKCRLPGINVSDKYDVNMHPKVDWLCWWESRSLFYRKFKFTLNPSGSLTPSLSSFAILASRSAAATSLLDAFPEDFLPEDFFPDDGGCDFDSLFDSFLGSIFLSGFGSGFGLFESGFAPGTSSLLSAESAAVSHDSDWGASSFT